MNYQMKANRKSTIINPCLILPVSLFLLALSSVHTPQTQEEEYNVKAACIYNFTKFIEWNPSGSDAFVIGVIGDSPIEQALSEIASIKTVQGKKISIVRFHKPDEITACQMLFISKENSFPLGEILSKASEGMVTIGEKPGFALRGTMFNLLIRENRLRFEANTTAIANAGVKVSSQLLKLAIIVE